MITRQDVMVYGAMIAAFCTLAAGFCFDIGYRGSSFAFGAITAGSVVAAFLAYLEPNA
jgi:hypothetical protein